ncbi:MAG: hydroxylamine reductase [Treponema sp.]|nr:hydroxylamine reductase [Treponema sp.]
MGKNKFEVLSHDFKEAFLKINYGLYVITSKEGNKDNGCVVDALMQLTDEPPIVAFSINKVNMTHDMVINSNEFNISVLTDEAPKELFKLFSAKSGRYISKFEEFPDAKRSENGVYHLTKYVNAIFSGKIIDAIDAGTHTLFRGEIQSAEVISGGKTLSYSDYRRDAKYRQMFCYQCQQTAKGSGCTMAGVCGKKPETAVTQDILTCELISLAVAIQENFLDYSSAPNLIDLIVDGLFMCITNVNFDTEKIAAFSARVNANREKLDGIEVIKHEELFNGDENIRSLRSTLLFGLRGMAAYAHHARVLGKRDREVDNWFVKGMSALGMEHTANEWLGLLMEFGGVNLKCMEILDAANTGAYGNPEPKRVSLLVDKGPFIVVTGHDLRDLKMLLEQTDGKGVNIYTHSEMLPAHGYPELRKYPHLKGHFGTAWQNQQNEFKNLPAPVLFTTNCIMPPKESYADRVYTTSIVQYPGIIHIEEDQNGYKDFSVVIERALMLGGFSEDMQFTGLNGGMTMTTGFGRKTVLDNAPAIIDAVKSGAIKHFFLVGGCDGAQSSHSYYTDFVKQTPPDTVTLTLACGKFRFNDLDAGSIGTFPRIMDMGQCNDSYGAVEAAIALAEAFNCGVNDLPLTLVLSWYEQKAVCILLTLLSLGIKNIYIGPSVPAFFSEAILKVIVDKFDLHLITTPEKDLEKILKK